MCYLRLHGPNWTAVTSSWPSGAVVKACHAGGRGFKSPLEHFFFFSSSFHIQTSFHCSKKTYFTITYFINELLLKEDIIIASAHLSIWYIASTCMSFNQN